MKIRKNMVCAIVSCSIVWTGGAGAQTPAKEAAPPATKTPASADSNKAKSDKPVENKSTAAAVSRVPAAGPALSFLPPAPGTPIRREGGATRGGVGDARELALSVIAPEQAGWSSTDQPELFWFTSRTVSNSILLTINPASSNAIDPLYEGPLAATGDGGIQMISLQKLGVKLVANTDYEWSVSLVTDPKSPSRDLVASGRLRYAPLSADLRAVLSGANDGEQAERLARSGYWYDVVRLMRQRFPASAAEISLYETAGLARIARFLRAGS